MVTWAADGGWRWGASSQSPPSKGPPWLSRPRADCPLGTAAPKWSLELRPPIAPGPGRDFLGPLVRSAALPPACASLAPRGPCTRVTPGPSASLGEDRPACWAPHGANRPLLRGPRRLGEKPGLHSVACALRGSCSGPWVSGAPGRPRPSAAPDPGQPCSRSYQTVLIWGLSSGLSVGATESPGARFPCEWVRTDPDRALSLCPQALPPAWTSGSTLLCLSKGPPSPQPCLSLSDLVNRPESAGLLEILGSPEGTPFSHRPLCAWPWGLHTPSPAAPSLSSCPVKGQVLA